MSSRSRISIITVVRNGADCLEETILSVVGNRTAVPLDYLIIDGGSTDGTLEIIKRYADRIAYLASEPDAGIYDAMNKGWAAAKKGSFVLFLGAGDRLVSLPDSMDRFDPQDVVYGVARMGEHTVFQARADYRLKLYNSLHHQALLVPKSLHPAPPFDVRYPVYADFDFNQRLKKRGAKFVFSPLLVSYARPGGVSDRPVFGETLRIVRANYGFFWAALALSGYYALQVFPFLKRLRPFREL